MSDQDLLDILQAHGQQFLKFFTVPNGNSRSEDVKPTPGVLDREQSRGFEDLEEWEGIVEGDVASTTSNLEALSGTPQIVVFENASKNSPTSKVDNSMSSQKKNFMSSKVAKLRDGDQTISREKKAEEQEDERSNSRNDAMLHRLIHTQLLNNALDPKLDATPAQRRRDLAGRILEISGEVTLGKGEGLVREKERNRAAKRVRNGLIEKQRQRARQELVEAKELGNYHPTIKKLFGPTKSPLPKRRERGLKMGIGQFKGGLLRLSRDEINMVHDGGAARSKIRNKSG